MKTRPNVLTVAGFDPSNGAGLTADIKTFEALKVYGLSVCTANTIQNDVDFVSSHWVDLEVIKHQIDILFDRFTIKYAKIGIVPDWSRLLEIIEALQGKNPDIKIVLDPVLKSSSGFDFHHTDVSILESAEQLFNTILSKVYLLTPNYKEIEELFPDKTIEETIQHISGKTNVLLKGGHRKDALGVDELFTVEGKHLVFKSKANSVSEKHGSGCVFSSAVVAYLAQGFSLQKACFRAKRYIERVLSSNKSLLGYHSI